MTRTPTTRETASLYSAVEKKLGEERIETASTLKTFKNIQGALHTMARYILSSDYTFPLKFVIGLRETTSLSPRQNSLAGFVNFGFTIFSKPQVFFQGECSGHYEHLTNENLIK